MHPGQYQKLKAGSASKLTHNPKAGSKPEPARDLKADAEPDLARIRETTDRYPVSRSWIYREAAAGNIRLVKLGSTTLVDLASVRDVLARLPAAKLRAAKSPS